MRMEKLHSKTNTIWFRLISFGKHLKMKNHVNCNIVQLALSVCTPYTSINAYVLLHRECVIYCLSINLITALQTPNYDLLRHSLNTIHFSSAGET